jgi:hypothetical protein
LRVEGRGWGNANPNPNLNPNQDISRLHLPYSFLLHRGAQFLDIGHLHWVEVRVRVRIRVRVRVSVRVRMRVSIGLLYLLSYWSLRSSF